MSDDTAAAAQATTPAPNPILVLPAVAAHAPIEVRRDWIQAHVMLDGYMARHSADVEEWELVGCEVPFTGAIINPETGAESRSFVMAGVFDKIARHKPTGELWIWEHKTTGQLNGGYLERLWLDNQITTYSIYAEEKYGQPIAGVMYDVLQKSKIEWKEGETPAAFEARKLTMKAPGRAKQQKADTEQTYGERLLEAHADASRMFYHREQIMFDKADLDEQRAEIWELCKGYLHSQSRGFWPKNTSQCFTYNRRCEMHQICASRGNPVTIETMYRLKQRHSELRAAGVVDETGHIPGDPRTVVTNSFLSTFRNCQRLAKLKYVDSLALVGESVRSLVFGKAVHAALEVWDTTHHAAKVREALDLEFQKPDMREAYAQPETTEAGANATDAFFNLPDSF